MATANIDEGLLERNIAYFKDTLLQIQCHNFNWEYEKVPRVVASMLIGDLKRILKCAVFLKENRILLLTEELDLPSRFELHENLRNLLILALNVDIFMVTSPFLMLVTTLTWSA